MMPPARCYSAHVAAFYEADALRKGYGAPGDYRAAWSKAQEWHRRAKFGVTFGSWL